MKRLGILDTIDFVICVQKVSHHRRVTIYFYANKELHRRPAARFSWHFVSLAWIQNGSIKNAILMLHISTPSLNEYEKLSASRINTGTILTDGGIILRD